jgi:hypothetical protein
MTKSYTKIESVTEDGVYTVEFDNDEKSTWTSRLQTYINFLRGSGFIIPPGAVKIDCSSEVWGHSDFNVDEFEWYEGIVYDPESGNQEQ